MNRQVCDLPYFEVGKVDEEAERMWKNFAFTPGLVAEMRDETLGVIAEEATSDQ
ncbi:MAG: hypothetical protein IIZ13_14605 [Renibacterium sp.]|nr:hypothetical protein [Renibacterium sp.]